MRLSLGVTMAVESVTSCRSSIDWDLMRAGNCWYDYKSSTNHRAENSQLEPLLTLKWNNTTKWNQSSPIGESPSFSPSKKIYCWHKHLVDINNIASTHMSFWMSFFVIVGMLSFHRSRLLFSSFFNAFLFSLLFPPFLLIPLPLPCCHISTSFLLMFLFLFFLQLPQVPSLWHLFSLQDRNPICRGLLWAPLNKYF